MARLRIWENGTRVESQMQGPSMTQNFNSLRDLIGANRLEKDGIKRLIESSRAFTLFELCLRRNSITRGSWSQKEVPNVMEMANPPRLKRSSTKGDRSSFRDALSAVCQRFHRRGSDRTTARRFEQTQPGTHGASPNIWVPRGVEVC